MTTTRITTVEPQPQPQPRAVARWADEFGNTYTWPQGCADNRRSRVLARIRRFGIDCDEATLTIEPIKETS